MVPGSRWKLLGFAGPLDQVWRRNGREQPHSLSLSDFQAESRAFLPELSLFSLLPSPLTCLHSSFPLPTSFLPTGCLRAVSFRAASTSIITMGWSQVPVPVLAVHRPVPLTRLLAPLSIPKFKIQNPLQNIR